MRRGQSGQSIKFSVMPGGMETTIGLDNGNSVAVVLPRVRRNVRYKNCTGNGNRKGNESVSVEGMCIHFAASCFSCHSSVFSSIKFFVWNAHSSFLRL